MAVSRLSLWLMPATGPVTTVLADMIRRLARECGTPVFPPHVTVVGALDREPEEVVGIAAGLADEIPPLRIRLTEMAVEEYRFKALTLTVEPSAELAHLHALAVERLGVENKPHEPHLSLLYAELPEAEKRRRAEALDLHLPITIDCDRLAVWTTDETNVGGWERAGEVVLRG